MRFDHFCPWVNADVGLRNHHALLVFPAAIACAQWLFLIAGFSAVHKEPAIYNSTPPLQRYPLLSLLMLINFALSIFAVGLVASQTKLICSGFTSVEYMSFQKMSDPHNPYDQGCWRNLLSFLTMTGPGTELPDPKTSRARTCTLLSRTSRKEHLSDVQIPFLQASAHNGELV
jgi:palmitoyltransferase